MMGSGKSTVGKLLGKALTYPLLDSDGLIQQLAGQSIKEIFETEGEEAFRDMETEVLQQLMPFKACVIATGGGVVLRRKNWGYMHHGVVVWLNGSPELLARRTSRDGLKSRPLLGGKADQEQQGEDAYQQSLERLTRILEERKHQYAVADVMVPLEAGPSSREAEAGASTAVVTYRVLKALKERLQKDAQEREEARNFEIKGGNDVPQTMRVMPSPAAGATQNEE
ncbi:hypothetical protein WJX72_002397 [[Myrmecia] bisecta]|uniref:shikimate kinase n=1 Tax=[Myrmecia] bisecta TaxID=41462 RepID=A0AAW1QPL6_9CHLO